MIKNYLYRIFNIIKHSIMDVIKYDGSEFAGYLAFLLIFFICPSLAMIASVTGKISSAIEIDHHPILISIIESMPDDITEGIKPRLTEIISVPPQNFLTISAIGMIWTSSSYIEGLRTILNRIYRTSNTPTYLLGRVLSIIQFLIAISMITFVIILISMIPMISDFLEKHLQYELHYAIEKFRYIMGLTVLFFITLWIHCAIPNAKRTLLQTIPGACVTIILWAFSAKVLSEYIKQFGKMNNIIYGGIKGIIFSLLFFYIINLCIIFGAALNFQIFKSYYKDR